METVIPYLSPLIGLVSFIVGTYLSFRFNLWGKRKDFTCEVLYVGRLAPLDDDYKHRLEVALDGNSVKLPSVFHIQFRNHGKISISKSEFDTPVTIEFPEDVNIIDAEVAEKSSKKLEVELTRRSNELSFEPLLLNSGDSFLIKLVIDGADLKFEVHGRIDGIPEIRRLDRSSKLGEWIRNYNGRITFALSLGICLLIMFCKYLPGGEFLEPLINEGILSFAALILVLNFANLLSSRKLAE